MRTEKENSIAFIHALRGIAPLLVLWAHLGGWWLSAAKRTSPLQDLWIRVVCHPLHLYQDGGHLGVLIFFLVSGFIITHVSLRESRSDFFIRRVFRLVPTLWLVLAGVFLLTLLAPIINVPWILGNYSTDYQSGFFLLNYFTGKPQVLTVLWTLFVEVLFYTLTFCVMNLSRTRPLLGTWLMLLTPLLANMAAIVFPVFGPCMWGIMYLPFLLVGRCIYLGWAKRITATQAILAGMASYGAFLIVYTNTSPGLLLLSGTEAIVSHLIAMLLFLALCFSGMRTVPRPLAFCADISYSLYLLHAPVGGLLLCYLTGKGLTYEVALPIAIIAVLCIAYLIFRFVEQRAQLLGRVIAERFRTHQPESLLVPGELKEQP